MEPWSEPIPTNNFIIKFFLDTMILSFCLDNKYVCLNKTISFLLKSEFAAVISSEIVLLELASLRKRLFYLQAIKTKFPQIFKDGSSDLIKLEKIVMSYGDYSKLPYNDVKDKIKEVVLNEINVLRTSTPKIEFDSNTFHNNIYEYTANLILSSNISRADGMVLISALLPAPEEPEEHLYLITKDRDFVNECNAVDLESTLNNLGLIKPEIERITSLVLSNGTHLDLTNSFHENRVEAFWIEKIKELLVQKNPNLFLGYTYVPHNLVGSPANCVDFKLNADTPLNKNLTLLIISNSLDFVYNVKVPVSDFWNNKSIENYPFKSNEVKNISFCALDYDGDDIVQTNSSIISRLREPGHLVFTNPFSYE